MDGLPGTLLLSSDDNGTSFAYCFPEVTSTDMAACMLREESLYSSDIATPITVSNATLMLTVREILQN